MIVDASVLTRLADPSVRDRLVALRTSRRLHRASITDLELGHSPRTAAEWDLVKDRLGAFGLVEVEAHHLRRASNVQRLLVAAGRRGRSVPDLIIAACAEDHGLPVLHYDADYDHIASVTGQPVEWVVERGSID